MSSLRLVAYNFLAGGSAKRAGQWSRVMKALRLGQIGRLIPRS